MMALSDTDLLVDAFAPVKISVFAKLAQLEANVSGATLGPDSVVRFCGNQYIQTTTPSLQDPLVVDIQKESVDGKKNACVDAKRQVAPIALRPNPNAVLNELLLQLEQRRQSQVQLAVDERAKRFSDFAKRQREFMREQSELRRKKLMEQMRESELIILKTIEEHDRGVKEHARQLNKYYETLEEKRRQTTKELEEHEKKKQKLHAIVEAVKKNHAEFCGTYQKMVGDIKNFSDPVKLKESLDEDTVYKLKSLPGQMDEIVKRCKARTIDENDCQLSKDLVEELKDLQTAIEERIINIKENQQRLRLSITSPQITVTSSSSQQQIPTKQQTALSQENQSYSDEIYKYVSKTSLLRSVHLQSYFNNYKKSFENLLNDPNLKQFKFDCQKAINIPVNAISPSSGHHLLDKYNRLFNLLSGKTVQIGDKSVCAINHPEGLAFCTHLLARKFVVQADLMISGNPDAAFCYASVIVSLWIDNAEFGQLLLSQFYDQSPYLIPMYIPDVEDKNQQYYLTCGYRYTDGIIESQDKFLKRMTGLMKLYSAIIIAKPKRGKGPNTIGLVEGWRWLAAFLNLDPRPHISSTLLYVFLETCGWAMENAYGKEFRKLIEYICSDYFTILSQIDSGGPIVRLEGLLMDYHQKKKWPVPEALLPDNFW